MLVEWKILGLDYKSETPMSDVYDWVVSDEAEVALRDLLAGVGDHMTAKAAHHEAMAKADHTAMQEAHRKLDEANNRMAVAYAHCHAIGLTEPQP